MPKLPEKRKKYSLVFATIVAFCSVCTAGVSTFAWFQATANVSISATNSSTTITVSAPESQYEYYAYRGNRNSSHVCGSTDVDEDGDYDFNDDFELLTSSNVSTETNLESLGFYPGKSFSFCLKLNGLTQSSSEFSLYTSKIISNDVSKQGGELLNRYVSGTSPKKKINVGWAINLHSHFINAATATPAGYSTFVSGNAEASSYLEDYPDLFPFTQNSTGDYDSELLEDEGDASNRLELELPLIAKTTAASTSAYLFYRIAFSKSTSTLYQEVDDSGNYLITPPTTGDRYFVKYTEGDTTQFTSNCYSGLKFALSELSATIE